MQIKEKRRIAKTLLLCMILVLLSGCGGQVSGGSGESDGGGGGNSSGDTLYLNIGTGPSTGMYYSYGTAMGELWNKYIGNIAVTAQSSNADAAAIFSSAPVSSVMQLCSTANCKIITLTQDGLDTIIAK